MNWFEALQLQKEQELRLKNVRSHKDDVKLVMCPDCGQLMKKKCLLVHSQSHVGRIVIGEEATIGMLDEIRRQKILAKTFDCPEDDKRIHRML